MHLCNCGKKTLEERYKIIEDQRDIAQKQLIEATERVQFLDHKLSE